MPTVDLSVSIVLYRTYDSVLALMESIEKYTPDSLKKKIFIIDNSSLPDGEPGKADFISSIANYSDAEYIDAGSNIGFGAGHNLVLPRLESRYHAIVNPDILLCEDAFSKIISYMDSDPDIGMCIPRLLDESGSLQPVYRRELTVSDMFIRMFIKKGFQKRKAYHTMQDMDYSKPFPVPFGQGSFLVIRTELFAKLDGFDERFFLYMEDADLCKRVNKVSGLMYYPGARVIHKWEKGSHKSPKLFFTHVRSMIKYFRKWSGSQM